MKKSDYTDNNSFDEYEPLRRSKYIKHMMEEESMSEGEAESSWKKEFKARPTRDHRGRDAVRYVTSTCFMAVLLDMCKVLPHVS